MLIDILTLRFKNIHCYELTADESYFESGSTLLETAKYRMRISSKLLLLSMFVVPLVVRRSSH